MQVGKTIGVRREKMVTDSERERVRRVYRKRRLVGFFSAMLFFLALVYLGARAVQEWLKWTETKEQVIVFAKEPSVKVIDEVTGQTFSDSATQSSRKLSSRRKPLILAHLRSET